MGCPQARVPNRHAQGGGSFIFKHMMLRQTAPGRVTRAHVGPAPGPAVERAVHKAAPGDRFTRPGPTVERLSVLAAQDLMCRVRFAARRRTRRAGSRSCARAASKGLALDPARQVPPLSMLAAQ